MPWFRLDDSFHSHPKVIEAGNEAVGLYARCGTYAAQHLTDGFIPEHVMLLYGSPALADTLVRTKLLRRVRKGWQMPDYLDYNPSAEQVKQERKQAAERQRRRRGAMASRRDSREDSRRESHDPDPAPSPTSKDVGGNVRADIEHVCHHLADRIEANGAKRPNVTKRWRDAARLMLDSDGRTEDQVMRCIDWSQDHEFWRSVILSMPKLRQRYDQLRLQASRREILNGNGRQAETDAQFERQMARAQARENHDPERNGAAHPLRESLLPAAGDG